MTNPKTAANETPEHRACRESTSTERRGAEQRDGRWRVGNHNARNLYIGATHVGVMFDPTDSVRVADVMNAAEMALSVSVGDETGPAVLADTETPAAASAGSLLRRRLKACVEAWPGAEIDGDYNPKCCRFPKSCSASVYDERYVTEDDLEPL